MDIIAIIGMVLTFALTQLFKQKPAMKDNAPAVISVLSMVIGAIQAALTASPASAAEAVAAASGGSFLARAGEYALTNLGGSVLIHNAAKKWIGEWLFGKVIAKFIGVSR
jgi:hypothetical protein